MRYTRSLFLIASVFLNCSVPARALDEPRGKVMIVLDGSGSMWGQIDGTTKIEIARNAVKDMVGNWDPSLDVGLTVYGHRRKGDCGDIEALIPVGELNPAEFTGAVEKISPKGKTPISDAVEQAAKALKYTEEQATVILVSDGIETCDRDPCAVAKALNDSGVQFTTHVIGFDVSKEDEIAQLKCVADNTGGKFLSAADAASLQSSLQEAVKEVAKKRAPVELVAVYEPGGQPVSDVHWGVFVDAVAAAERRRVASTSVTTPRLELDPGSYRVTVNSTRGRASAESTFVIPESHEGLRHEVLLPQEGIVQLVAVNEPGGEPVEGVHWNLYKKPLSEIAQKRKVQSAAKDQPEFQLAPGSYIAEVISTAGKASAEQEIEVVLGEQKRIEVLLSKEGIINLRAVNEAGGEPLSNVHWEIFEPAESEMAKPKKLKAIGADQPEVKLLPGRYRAVVYSTRGSAQAEKDFEVAAGTRETVELSMAAEGMVDLVAVYAEGGDAIEGVHWELYQASDDSMTGPRKLKTTGNDTPTLTLLPGEYTAKVKVTQGQAEADVSFAVEAGKRVRVEARIPKEGIVELRAVTETGGDPREGVYWEFFQDSGDPLVGRKKFKTTGSDTPELRLLPGTYIALVKSTNGMASTEAAFEVEAGKRVIKEIILPQEGIIELSAIDSPGGAPAGDVYWEVYEKAKDELSSPKRVKASGSDSASFLLLPGQYLVKVSHIKSKTTAEQEVEVAAGKRTPISVVLPIE